MLVIFTLCLFDLLTAWRMVFTSGQIAQLVEYQPRLWVRTWIKLKIIFHLNTRNEISNMFHLNKLSHRFGNSINSSYELYIMYSCIIYKSLCSHITQEVSSLVGRAWDSRLLGHGTRIQSRIHTIFYGVVI